MGSAIEVRGLVKRYGESTAVAGIDLDVDLGEVVAILGPNGAGKTTTVEILEGHRDRTSGEVRVLGVDPQIGGRAYRERVGIVLQTAGVPKEHTPRELIDLFGGMYPRRRPTDEILEVVGLVEKADARVKTLSGGQQRRVDLALGLVGDPELLFLDEPTTGFDPTARRQSWEVVSNLAALGKTVVLTTHYLDEAQALAGRVIVLAGGRIVADGTPQQLGGRETAAAAISFDLPLGVSADDLPALGTSGAAVSDGRVVVTTSVPTAVVHDLSGWALERGIELAGLTVSRPSLEDIYLGLVATDTGAGGAS